MSNTDSVVYNTLSDAGVPGARMMWGPQPPSPPYFTYEALPKSLYADNDNHATVDRYKASLFMSDYDEALVTRFEGAIAALGAHIRHSDAIEGGLHVLTWSFSIVRGAD